MEKPLTKEEAERKLKVQLKMLELQSQAFDEKINKVRNEIHELEKQNKKLNIYMCDNLEDTVKTAKKIAKENQIVLFSPASASFDMFKNFADRGIQFKNLVNKL